MIECAEIDYKYPCTKCGLDSDIKITNDSIDEDMHLCEDCFTMIMKKSRKVTATYIIMSIAMNIIFSMVLAMVLLAVTSLLIRLYQYLF